jgi:pentatricopeptide repeat protein
MKRLKYPGDVQNLKMMLQVHHVSWQEYLQTWKPVVYSSNINNALSALSRKLDIAVEDPLHDGDILPGPRVPFWLSMHIASHKVHTSTQAHGILQYFVFSQLPHMPLALQPAFLLVFALSLARFSLLAPMRRVVRSFLAIPQSRRHEQLYFNILLHTIARFGSSQESADLVVTVLEAMDARQLKLHSSTYSRLLSDRFVTLQLTKMLWNRMKNEGFVPTKEHLEDFVRIFAKKGSIHDSKAYLQEISTRLPKHIMKAAPSDFEDSDNEIESLGSPDRVHTLFMNNFRQNRVSAFQYLEHLLLLERRRTSVAAFQDPALPLVPQKHRFRNQRSLRIPQREFVNIHVWTTALAVAARDLRGTSGELLLSLFERASKTVSFRPTTVTYTVVLQGLLHRKMFPETLDLWYRLESSGLHIDRKALTAGVEIFTRSGRPHEGFALLEKYAGRYNARLGIPNLPSRTEQAPVTMNAMAMNQFLISLVRIQRPDVVFRLWNYMETLYGIRPDAKSLSILLKATRVATKNDNSFKGALAHMARLLRKPPASPRSREEIVSSMKDILGDPDRGLVPYRSGWDDVPAWQVARQIFHEVVLGNWPTLKHVQPPAAAVRVPGDDNSFWPVLQLPRSITKPSSNTVSHPQVNLHLATNALYPEIVPTNETFLRYIQVLGEHFPSEIPLALAWMRALKIEPRRLTLAMALVFWGEVSFRPPLVERWSPQKSEYAKLVDWIRDWVPPEVMPHGAHIAICSRMVARMKQCRNVSLGQGH